MAEVQNAVRPCMSRLMFGQLFIQTCLSWGALGYCCIS